MNLNTQKIEKENLNNEIKKIDNIKLKLKIKSKENIAEQVIKMIEEIDFNISK